MYASPLWDSALPPLQWTAVIGVSLTAAVWDLRVRRIPNVLTAPFALAGLIWATWSGGGWGLLDGVLGCLIAAFPFVVLFVFAGGGAGDAKLMGGIGCWLGVTAGVVALVSVAICGGLLAIGYAVAFKRIRPVLAHFGAMCNSLLVRWRSRLGLGGALEGMAETKAPMTRMPYGMAIFLGTCAALGVWLVWHKQAIHSA